jgi:hypothetical protein
MSEHHDETRAEAVQAAEAHADAPHADAPHGETGGEEPALHVDRYEGIWMRLAVIILIVFFILIAVSAF